ncbi:toll/interleukin-1 receptor domain-containing protein [Streptomyces sp. NPDC004752]
MARPRIFVSHSSHPDKCAPASCACVAHRDAIVALLDELGCDPVIDQSLLRTGDEWHRKLMVELFHCQGTVLLLSPHALDSKYVMEEAMLSTILREVTGGRFVLLPVMLPGVRRADLEQSRLAGLGLGRLDLARWSGSAQSDAAPVRLTDRLRALVESHGSLPYPEVTEYLAGRIENVSAPMLSKVARQLGMEHIAYTSDHSNYVVSAGLLSERPVAEYGAECSMREALRELLPHLRHKDHRQEVVDVVVPFARVPGAAARQLHTLCETFSEGRVAVLTATNVKTAEMYVRRASESPAPWLRHTPVPRPGMDFVDSLIAEIHEFLVDQFLGFDMHEDELRRWLAREEEESGPVTIVLGVQPDAELLRRLLAAFPHLLFLFVHEQANVDGAAADLMCLEALSPGQERDMLGTYRRLSRISQ